MENRLSVGISHGDVNGISYELIIKLLAENRMCELCVPILYGSPKVAAYYRKALNAETFALNPIKEPSEANGKRSNIINCADDEVKVELGKETDESDRAAMAALKRALDHADGGHIDVVVAAPQGKGSSRRARTQTYHRSAYEKRRTAEDCARQSFFLPFSRTGRVAGLFGWTAPPVQGWKNC